ncbi:MAG TPA: CHAT domain-containing protein [Kofleriaceae bacterium]|jgi:hypothetical protein
MTKHTILFLAANPSETDRLALDREARAIQAELERSLWRDRFEFVTRWAAQPMDLLRELRRLRPTVVQFSGHGRHNVAAGGQDPAPHRDVVVDVGSAGSRICEGLYFQADDGTPRVVSAAALREAFHESSVKLVVLNACYSEVAAEVLVAHVDCVVGMAGSIHDNAARHFAVGLYCGLGNSASVESAYHAGRAAMVLNGSLDGERPRLKARPGVDPSRLNLAMLTPSPAVDEKPPRSVPPQSTIKSTAGQPAFTGREAEIDAVVDKLGSERAALAPEDRKAFWNELKKIIGRASGPKSYEEALALLFARLPTNMGGAPPPVIRLWGGYSGTDRNSRDLLRNIGQEIGRCCAINQMSLSGSQLEEGNLEYWAALGAKQALTERDKHVNFYLHYNRAEAPHAGESGRKIYDTLSCTIPVIDVRYPVQDHSSLAMLNDEINYQRMPSHDARIGSLFQCDAVLLLGGNNAARHLVQLIAFISRHHLRAANPIVFVPLPWAGGTAEKAFRAFNGIVEDLDFRSLF